MILSNFDVLQPEQDFFVRMTEKIRNSEKSMYPADDNGTLIPGERYPPSNPTRPPNMA